jgi:hypothetical protein
VQDKYTADVGDFGKYVLLNEIYRNSNGKLRIGINWYYVNREETKLTDGKYTEYLYDNCKNSKNYRICFPKLYDQLRRIVNDGRRNIKAIEKGSVLPEGTIFYSKPLPYSSKSTIQKGMNREIWFEESLAALTMADLIFLDPDNGIQTERINATQIKAMKYVLKDEIQRYYRAGKSLLIYTHRDRTPESSYKEKLRRRLLSITSLLCELDRIKIVKFKRYSVRDYVFLMQEENMNLVARTIESLTREPLSFLFQEYTLFG